MPSTIPAIVLTCQRHIPIAEHMIDRYHAKWPGHSFRFRLPDCSASRALANRAGQRIELVKTGEGEGRGMFRAAVLGLLGGLDDDEWVYWCIDDKYVEWIDIKTAQAVVDRTIAIGDRKVAGVSFARTRQLSNLHSDRQPTLRLGDLVLVRRPNYRQIWLHQLLRAKVLRTLFSGFPMQIDAAKDMHVFARAAQLPDDHRLYVTSRNAVVFGESTTSGRLTANCARSMVRGRGVPPGFKVEDRRIIIGSRPGIAGWILARLRAMRRWIVVARRRFDVIRNVP
jgi:hypothetical protein